MATAEPATDPVASRMSSAVEHYRRAIVLQAVWSSVLVATGTYRSLFTRVVYTEWIFFGALAVVLVIADTVISFWANYYNTVGNALNF